MRERTAELEKTYQAVEAEVVERRRAESTLRETNRLLQLYTVRSSKKEYLDAVVALLQEWTGCEGAGIRVLDKAGNIPYESFAGFSREFWESENFLSIRRDQCVCIRVAAGTPEPQDMACVTPCGSFHCEDTMALLAGLSAQEQERFRGRCIAEGYASVTIIPISYRNRILGAIHLADRTKAKIPPETVEFIESVQPLIGEAIHGLAVEEERTLLGLQLRQSQKMEALGTPHRRYRPRFQQYPCRHHRFYRTAGEPCRQREPRRTSPWQSHGGGYPGSGPRQADARLRKKGRAGEETLSHQQHRHGSGEASPGDHSGNDQHQGEYLQPRP